MKANELMIGDYVQLNGSPYVIEEISKKGWVHMTDPVHNLRVQMSTDYILDFIEGVPLTREILEANFEKKGANFGIFDDYFDFELHEYNDGTWLVSYHCCEMSLPDEQVMLFHVHQLQHFMHHCGIEKEITLNPET